MPGPVTWCWWPARVTKPTRKSPEKKSRSAISLWYAPHSACGRVAMRYSEIAVALHARLHGEDRLMQSVSIDSRNVSKDDLFVAIKGERFDGHDFLREVVAKGVAGVMVQQKTALDISQIVIDDTRLGLGRLARLWRDQYD